MKFIIEGQKPLRGEIKVNGAKNAALKMIAASILIEGKTILHNTPQIVDVENMLKIADKIGSESVRRGDVVEISQNKSDIFKLPEALTGALRGAIVFIGPLLSKHGKAVLPVPGGCAIGRRPITDHIDILGKLGVRATKEGDKYYFEKIREPHGTVQLLAPSVTATENAIMYLCVGQHEVLLRNCAQEPEIDDLIAMLNDAGAKIRRVGGKNINIIGVPKLNPVDHTIIGDRVEAGTWIVAGLLLGNPLKISGFNPEHLAEPIRLIRKMGGIIDLEQNAVRVKKSTMRSTQITTQAYPGFPTDLQSPFGLLLTQCNGRSPINETIFNDRLKYLDELKLMGARTKNISVHKAEITGPTPLVGKHIHSTDLRAGATMVLAGLIAEGKTIVDNAQIIDRGYQEMDNKLSAVGASIVRK